VDAARRHALCRVSHHLRSIRLIAAYQAVRLVGAVRAEVPTGLVTNRNRIPVHLSLMAMSRDGKSLVLANGWNSPRLVGVLRLP
jgi:hypothetical protein